jgi:hypothetical protein
MVIYACKLHVPLLTLPFVRYPCDFGLCPRLCGTTRGLRNAMITKKKYYWASGTRGTEDERACCVPAGLKNGGSFVG